MGVREGGCAAVIPRTKLRDGGRSRREHWRHRGWASSRSERRRRQLQQQGGEAAGWDDDDDATPPVRLVAGSARARLANHGELPLSMLARLHMAVPKHQNGLGGSEGEGGEEGRSGEIDGALSKLEKIRLELGAVALCRVRVEKLTESHVARGILAIDIHLHPLKLSSNPPGITESKR